MKNNTLIIGGLVGLLAAVGCGKKEEAPKVDSAATQPAPTAPAPAGQIMHGDTVVSSTGLMYIDTKKGMGKLPMRGQEVTVNYTGMLTDGKVFDSNVDPNFHHVEPFKTAIGAKQVIDGWDEGIMSMAVGGKRRLIVPASLGYGPQGMPPDIPGGATLIFDVELLAVH